MGILSAIHDLIFGSPERNDAVDRTSTVERPMTAERPPVTKPPVNTENEQIVIDSLRIEGYDAAWADDYRTVIEQLKQSGEVGKANSGDLDKLYKFSDKRLPDEVLWFFRFCNIPAGKGLYFGDVRFLGIEDVIRANTDAVPGYCVFPQGFMTIAETSIGDALCIDLDHKSEDGLEEVYEDYVANKPIYQIPHELVGEDGVMTLDGPQPLTRENIVAMSFKVGLDFSDFMLIMARDDIQLLEADLLQKQFDGKKKRMENAYN